MGKLFGNCDKLHLQLCLIIKMSLGLIRTVFLRTWRGERSLALLCTASITARGRGSKFARPMEKMKRRGRRIIVAGRGATHNTPTSEGREGHDTNSSWRERGRERGSYKPRARAVAAWATLLVLVIWGVDGGEDVYDAQVL